MKVIKKRVASRNPRVQLLTLALLEAAVDACGLPLHTQVSSKDSIVILGSVVKNRETDAEVKEKLMSLVQKWGMKFQESQDILPGFSELYNSLRQAGVSFSQAPTYQDTRPKESPQVPAPRAVPVASSAGRRLPPQKVEKLKSDLNVVRENVKVTNEMIDASEPGPAVSRNEVLTELTNTLRAMQGKLSKLIESVSDEELVAFSLTVKDEVDSALNRYQDLRDGRKPGKSAPERQPQATPASFLDMDLELPSPPRPPPQEKPKEAPPAANPLPFDLFGPAPTVTTQPRQDVQTFAPPPMAFPEQRPPQFVAQPVAPPVSVQPVPVTFPQPQAPFVMPAAAPQPTFPYAQPPAQYPPAGYQPYAQPAPAYTPQQPAQPAQPAFPGPPQVRIKHNMSGNPEEEKKAQDSKPKDLFDDLVQL